MKIWMDLDQFLPFFYPTFLVIGLLIYFFIRGIVVSVSALIGKSKDVPPKETAKETSKASTSDDSIAEPEEPRPFLTAEKIQIYRMAKVLFQQGKIVEASHMLETIGLAEKAVRVLIKHDKIDEAASTLLRMQAPDRAAELFERMQRFSQAAEIFMQLENWLKAAQCFTQMAQKDSQFYYMASECYGKAGLLNEALSARAKLGLVEDVFQLCVAHKSWVFLGQYLEFPAYAYRILPLFDESLLQEFFMELELVPHNALLLAHWLNYRSDSAMILTILRKLGEHPSLATIFWQHLDHYGFDTMSQKTLFIKRELNPAQLKTHAEALLAAGRAELAHKILAIDAVPPPPLTALVMKF